MARNVTKLTPEENKFFHINYDYMWKKLNTAPYYVSGSGDCPIYIRNEEELPSYVNLSKCRNPEFIPSINIVNKIVNFYNCNISPEITTFQFLKEDLSLTDSNRTQIIEGFDKSFIGTYYGYYYSETSSKKVLGAVIKIFEADNISLLDYKKYYDSLDLSLKRTTFYQGIASVTPKFLILYLNGIDKEEKKLVINQSTSKIANINQHLCGISFSVLISE